MPENDKPARHETSDVPLSIAWIGVPGLIVTVLLAVLLIRWMFPNGTTDRTLHLPLPRYPSPELQVSPRDDMNRFRAQELPQRIPIDRAMRQLAADGIEGWPAPVPQGSAQ
jgi:hypothetical protein